MSEVDEWKEEIVDPDVYTIALEKARDLVGRMREAWDYLLPVYRKLEPLVRKDIKELGKPSRDYDVVAVDSTFSPTLSLRGLRTGFILLAAVTYPKPIRPIFKLKFERSDPGDEEEDPSGIRVSRRAKKEELLLMMEVIQKRSDYDVVVRDGDFPPADALFGVGLTKLSHRMMEGAMDKGKGLAGLVKRISTSLIAYKYLREELTEILDSGPEEVPRRVLSDMLSDPVVAWLMLDPGDFLLIGKYGEEFYDKKFIVSYFSAMVRGGKRYSERMDKRMNSFPLFNEVEVGFYRPRAAGSPVVKLTGFNLDLWDFASYSAECTRGPSYPDFINLADAACIEHAKSVRPDMIMLDALRVASESEGLNKAKFRGRRADLVALQNVQKLYLFYRRGER